MNALKWLIVFNIAIIQLPYTQTIISKDSALSIAFNNGLEQGLDDISVSLVDGSYWEIRSLLCCGQGWKHYHFMKISGKTGKILYESKRAGEGGIDVSADAIKETTLNTSVNVDNLPIFKATNAEYRLTKLKNSDESKPALSKDNKLVAFQYGFRKIGIISFDGSGFMHLCDECFNPQWLDDNWITYFYDFRHIYKQNIHSGEKVKITSDSNRCYDDFKLSPDGKWIAFTKIDAVKTKSEKEAVENHSGGQALGSFGHTEGDRYVTDYWIAAFNDIWFFSTKNPEIKRKIQMRNGQAYMPCWSKDSDSLLFYIKGKKYFATNLVNDSINYYPLKNNDSLALEDIEKIRKGVFPFKIDCRIALVDATSLMPKYLLTSARAIYDGMILSDDLRYMIFSKQNRVGSFKSLWVMPLTR